MTTIRAAMLTSVFAIAATLTSPANATSYLGSASTFAILGGSAVTNTGPSTVHGDIGVAPGTSLTGMGSVTLTGSLHAADAVATLAQSDASTGWSALTALSPTVDLTGQVLGDMGSIGTLTPGVYLFSSTAQLDGALTLDFGSLHNQAFIFLIGSSLTTASASSILVKNGDAGSAIYWEVGSSATLGTGTTFEGNIIADQSITLTTGTQIACGRAIALNAAVTMDTNVVANSCPAGGDFGSDGFSGGNSYKSAVPEPSAWALMILGFGAIGGASRMARRRASLSA